MLFHPILDDELDDDAYTFRPIFDSPLILKIVDC